jgi:hypothetical protein
VVIFLPINVENNQPGEAPKRKFWSEAGERREREMEYNTVLLSFQEALAKQEYESCKKLIDDAKQSGINQNEIDAVIAAYLRGDARQDINKASYPKNRLRFF